MRAVGIQRQQALEGEQCLGRAIQFAERGPEVAPCTTERRQPFGRCLERSRGFLHIVEAQPHFAALESSGGPVGSRGDRLVQIACGAGEVVHLLTHAGRGHERGGGSAVVERRHRHPQAIGGVGRTERACQQAGHRLRLLERFVCGGRDRGAHLDQNPGEDPAPLQDVFGMAADDIVASARHEPGIAVCRERRFPLGEQVLRLRRDEPGVPGLPLVARAVGPLRQHDDRARRQRRDEPAQERPVFGGCGRDDPSVRVHGRHALRFGTRGVVALIAVADDERHAGRLNRGHSFTIGQETSPDGL